MYGFEGEVKSKYPFVPICCPLSDCSFSDVFSIKVFLRKCVWILTLCYIYCRYVWPLYRSVQLVASLSPYKPESAGKAVWFSGSMGTGSHFSVTGHVSVRTRYQCQGGLALITVNARSLFVVFPACMLEALLSPTSTKERLCQSTDNGGWLVR